MEKIFKKHETLFAIALIIIYVVANSYIMQNFGLLSYQSVIINIILSIFLINGYFYLIYLNYIA